MLKKITFFIILFLFGATIVVQAKLTLKEIRTATDKVVVVFFTSDTIDINEVNTDDINQWKINGEPVKSISKYSMQASACDHHIYLGTDKLQKGKKYTIETPYGKTEFVFNPESVFCESIKVNQVGYSSISKVRYANFAAWVGTGGSLKLEGELPGYRSYCIRLREGNC